MIALSVLVQLACRLSYLVPHRVSSGGKLSQDFSQHKATSRGLVLVETISLGLLSLCAHSSGCISFLWPLQKIIRKPTA